MNKSEDNVRKVLKNLFKEEAPSEDLEKEIIKTCDTIKMAGDIFELFTEKLGNAEIQLHTDLGEMINESIKKKLK